MMKKLFYILIRPLFYVSFVFYKAYVYGVHARYKKKYEIDSTAYFVGGGILLEGSGRIIIGKGSHVARNSWLSAFEGTMISIGNNTRIASNVTMITSNTKTGQDFSVSMNRSYGDIIIGDNCWIGVNVYIKEGVTIGDNCVIGANSVVTKSVPDNCIVTGCNMIRQNIIKD